MKIALFGSTGQVAQEVRRRAPNEIAVKSYGRDDADFSIPEHVSEFASKLDADVFLNAAAFTAVDDAEKHKEIADAVNHLSVAKLAEVSAKRSIPLVHISTDYVFNGNGDNPWTTDAPKKPLNTYGRSKLAGEEAIMKSGAQYIILRTSWVFSVHGNNFVKTMLRVGKNKPTLNVVADQIGGPTPAAAIADAAIEAAIALRRGAPSETYHLSGTPDVSWADFAREIFHQSRMEIQVHDIPTSSYPTPAKRPLNSRLDCRAIQDDLGINRPQWKSHLAEVLEELAAK